MTGLWLMLINRIPSFPYKIISRFRIYTLIRICNIISHIAVCAVMTMADTWVKRLWLYLLL